MAFGFLVVHGAVVSCSQGSAPSSLTVAVSKCVAQGSKIGVISDKVVGTFGTCALLGPGPCAPAFPGNWSPGCSKVKCSAVACIKGSDSLACSIGGSVTIISEGQVKVRGK